MGVGGAEAFYRGPIAERIVGLMEAAGGLLTAADLAGYRPRWLDPITTTYRGRTVRARETCIFCASELAQMK